MRTFRIDVPQREIDDLTQRLAAAQGRLNGLRDGLVEHHGRQP